jgi:hypothetical protein
MEKYYWNSEHRLGRRENAIKKGDELPESYQDDPRLERWLAEKIVSKTKPSDTSLMTETIDDLKRENINLAAQVNVLTGRLKSVEGVVSEKKLLSEQNKSLREKLDAKTSLMMNNETKIGEVIKQLREERVSKDERLEAAQILADLQRVGGNEA